MSSTWYVERVMPTLFTGGFFIHLIHLSRWVTFGRDGWDQVISRGVDAPLAVIMTYCSAALIIRRRQLYENYDFSPHWRRICYWVFVIYVTASIPGHILYLTTGITTYFDIWPIWYSGFFLAFSVISATFWVTLPPTPRTERSDGSDR